MPYQFTNLVSEQEADPNGIYHWDLPPMPYQFTNLVSEQEADPNGIYWTQEEKAEESNPGRVDGSYSVWQPDGRLMTVTYYVDGDSGFVSEITFTDNYSPSF